MTIRKKLLIVFLWFSVINLSIWVGGTIFHMIVVVPIWSGSPPGSVKDFFGANRAYDYLLNFYGPPWMFIRTLPIFVSLLLGWDSKPHRSLLLVTSLSIVFGILLTIIFVYPINDAIMAKAGEGKSPDEIKRMVGNWIFADRLRFAVMFVGYCCLLWAFRLPVLLSKEQ